jgi:hypothetical protein
MDATYPGQTGYSGKQNHQKEKTRYTVNGELLYDNQDICVMMNISKQTL